MWIRALGLGITLRSSPRALDATLASCRASPLRTDPSDKVLTAVKPSLVRRVSLPVHHIAVNPCDSPWLVGVTATVDATDSRAPVNSYSSDRRASFFKFPAIVDALYKLMARAAALPHRETRAPTPTLNRPPELTNFQLPPNPSPPPRTTPYRGQPFTGLLMSSLFLF